MKRWWVTSTVAFFVFAGITTAGSAHAVPISCGYPATGYYVRADVAIVTGVLFACDFPREINGAHLHQEELNVDVGFNTGANIANGGGSNNLGAGLNFGGETWTGSWRCPDQRYLAEQPNPVGAWNKPIVAARCTAIGVAPSAPPDTPWPPGDTMAVFVWPPPLVPGSPGPVISPPIGNEVLPSESDDQPNGLGVPDGKPPATRVN